MEDAMGYIPPNGQQVSELFTLFLHMLKRI
jgi:hypothetical protein